MQQISVPLKTRGMLIAERQLGRPLEEVLQELYVEQGLTQPEVAERLGIAESTVSRWMTALGVEARYLGRRRRAVA